MILSLENLDCGVRWWINTVPKWGPDLVNSEYVEIFRARDTGITEWWWKETVDRLWDWRAIRSPRPPNSKQQIFGSGVTNLVQIDSIISGIRSYARNEPSITDVSWEQIAPLFDVAFRLKCGEKKSGSPVFASKMCHFIFPDVFPVVDNLATGYFDYEFYWRGMKDEWLRFLDKDRAILKIRDQLKDYAVHECYPFKTKIIELCHIGYSHC
jgi:hypothetical protein